MLRQPGSKQPDARLTALLQKLVTQYAYRALSTDDLQHEVESVMTPAMDLVGGRSMNWLFDEWVRGTGILHYGLDFSAPRADIGSAVRGKLFTLRVPRWLLAAAFLCV